MHDRKARPDRLIAWRSGLLTGMSAVWETRIQTWINGHQTFETLTHRTLSSRIQGFHRFQVHSRHRGPGKDRMKSSLAKPVKLEDLFLIQKNFIKGGNRGKDLPAGTGQTGHWIPTTGAS